MNVKLILLPFRLGRGHKHAQRWPTSPTSPPT